MKFAFTYGVGLTIMLCLGRPSSIKSSNCTARIYTLRSSKWSSKKNGTFALIIIEWNLINKRDRGDGQGDRESSSSSSQRTFYKNKSRAHRMNIHHSVEVKDGRLSIAYI